ncbi:MAG: hypothetical protein CBC29_09880 [Methylococcaceae bacterium TMED69]|nr:MAG: hypothetical protein CBC29_09880 [Methylococcaceae bacterium TMED69]|tara:strand:+ start:3662 stop:4210 length:549 start_codon:yes stop_codon:yes gene_type:complete
MINYSFFSKVVLVMALLMGLNGCANGIKGGDYLNREPAFVIEEFFQGEIKAWGIIQDRRGKIITRFEADIIGTWDGNNGTLDETFTYLESGENQKRIWKITKNDELNYTGTAGDIIGEATGKQYGNAVNWVYSMDVPVGSRKVRLKFDDWLWSMDKKVAINRSYLKKFGVTVAEITLFLQQQ